MLQAISCLVLALAVGAPAAPPTLPPPVPKPARSTLSPSQALAKAVGELVTEAEAVAADERAPRETTDFAQAFLDEHPGARIPASQAMRKLGRPLHRDPYVDAYVRWQLTGFVPEMPKLVDRAFDALLAALPPFAENPRADGHLLATLRDIVRWGELDEATQEQLRASIEQLQKDDDRARRRNEPADALRTWLFEQVGPTGRRAVEVRLEAVGARLRAGWPLDRAKAALDACCVASASDVHFTPDERRRVAAQFTKMVGQTRVFAKAIEVLDGRIDVEYGDATVADFEVRRWTRAFLEPRDP